MKILLFIALYVISGVRCQQKFGPFVKATAGEIWPDPRKLEPSESFFILSENFNFKVIGNNCLVLIDALERYKDLIFEYSEVKFPSENFLSKDPLFRGRLEYLNISLSGKCDDNEYPSFDMKEEYKLYITNEEKILSSGTIWGIYRGLETFSHLVHRHKNDSMLVVNMTKIYDYPKFPHRGILLDTSRHFIPVESIKKTLDSMSYTKLNVFHWHVTDDESFPFKSLIFPELSVKGSYNKKLIYGSEDIIEIIEYAKRRGIRVIPEFTTPSHTQSWGSAFKNLLTPCFDDKSILNGKLGPLDPSKSSTYTFLKELLQEVKMVFPDSFMHLGGNDVNYTCWKSNPNITEFMKVNNITNNYNDLLKLFMEQLIQNLHDDQKIIVWEEIFNVSTPLPNSSIVQVWKQTTWPDVLNNITRSHHHALLSSCWPADQLISKGAWAIFYLFCSPSNWLWPASQRSLIAGGEVTLYTSIINEHNLDSLLWPKACAAAEVLWSGAGSVMGFVHTAKRLEEHICRMERRGIRAEPANGPGVCLK